jgi:hypothetical protein
MTRTLDYLRRNALAALALVCSLLSLAGASYAAFSLPAGSVGTRELRNGAVTNTKVANGSITPAKLDSRAIGGSVRHWAHVSQTGQVLGGSKGTRVSAGGPIFGVSWGDRFSSRCAALITPAGNAGSAPIADTTGVVVVEPGAAHGSTVVNVTTYVGGTAASAPFYIAVVC